MMTDPTNEGMTFFSVRRIDSEETPEHEYECLDEGCARLLAAGEHGGDPEDYEVI
jgi:hypothetical protein